MSRRKTPVQERSIATVDAIVEATAQLLRHEGYNASLRKIADRAGVSVGSIYQYFPNKAALLSAVMRRHIDEMAPILMEALQSKAESFEARVRILIAAVVTAHAADPALHRVLVEEVPRVQAVDGHQQLLDLTTHAVTELLRQHRDELRPGDPVLMARVVVSAVEASVHALVLHQSLDPATCTEELTHLALGYLSKANANGRNQGYS